MLDSRNSHSSTPSTSLVVGIILIVLSVLIAFGIVIFIIQRRRKRYEHLFRQNQLPHRHETDDTLRFVEPRRREGSLRVDGDEEWGTLETNVNAMEEVHRPSRAIAAVAPSSPSSPLLAPPVPAKNSHTHRIHGNIEPEDEEGGEEYDPLVYYSDIPPTPRQVKDELRGRYDKDENEDDHITSLLPSNSVPQLEPERLPILDDHPPPPPPPPTDVSIKGELAARNAALVIPPPPPPPLHSPPPPTDKDTTLPASTPAYSQTPTAVTPQPEQTEPSSRRALPPPPIPPQPPTKNGNEDGDAHLHRTATEVVSTLLKYRAVNGRQFIDRATGGKGRTGTLESVEHIERSGSIVSYSKRGGGGKVGEGNGSGRSVRFVSGPRPPLPPLPPIPTQGRDASRF
ncbi:hypothetical protein E1B28_010698 [Marasmius oreades]|uniref:Uncharacterized protein n=1 Tax=Marasmius oreades TaxID=181124 RepID=A0A9P7RZ60_9AGAR|nr:uncharacterized protein E1B28_010698 [Marasmius oreades]KAG7091678.1 hypothetical protein E1B28_010698 [Marasmius oreades]